MPISGVQRAVMEAVDYARTLSDDVRAVYVNGNPAITARVRTDWQRWGGGVPLVVLESPCRSLLEPLRGYVDCIRAQHPAEYLTVVLPRFVPARWWHNLFHNQRALLIKQGLILERNVIVTSVPFRLEK